MKYQQSEKSKQADVTIQPGLRALIGAAVAQVATFDGQDATDSYAQCMTRLLLLGVFALREIDENESGPIPDAFPTEEKQRILAWYSELSARAALHLDQVEAEPINDAERVAEPESSAWADKEAIFARLKLAAEQIKPMSLDLASGEATFGCLDRVDLLRVQMKSVELAKTAQHLAYCAEVNLDACPAEKPPVSAEDVAKVAAKLPEPTCAEKAVAYFQQLVQVSGAHEASEAGRFYSLVELALQALNMPMGVWPDFADDGEGMLKMLAEITERVAALRRHTLGELAPKVGLTALYRPKDGVDSDPKFRAALDAAKKAKS